MLTRDKLVGVAGFTPANTLRHQLHALRRFEYMGATHLQLCYMPRTPINILLWKLTPAIRL